MIIFNVNEAGFYFNLFFFGMYFGMRLYVLYLY